MSYGTYDNQSPLNQPFNPTANKGNIEIMPGGPRLGGGPAQLPGAQDPNSQQYFQQANESHQELGEALKNIQGLGNNGGKSGAGGMIPMFGGGKSSVTPFNPTDVAMNQRQFTQNF